MLEAIKLFLGLDKESMQQRKVEHWHRNLIAKRFLSKKIGNRICLMGNIPPVDVLLRGTPLDVEKRCKIAILEGGPGGGFLLSSAGGLVKETPLRNLDAMIKASEKYGRYPFTS